MCLSSQDSQPEPLIALVGAPAASVSRSSCTPAPAGCCRTRALPFFNSSILKKRWQASEVAWRAWLAPLQLKAVIHCNWSFRMFFWLTGVFKGTPSLATGLERASRIPVLSIAHSFRDADSEEDIQPPPLPLQPSTRTPRCRSHSQGFSLGCPGLGKHWRAELQPFQIICFLLRFNSFPPAPSSSCCSASCCPTICLTMSMT